MRLSVKVTPLLFHRGGGSMIYAVSLAIASPVSNKNSAFWIAVGSQTVSDDDVKMCILP